MRRQWLSAVLACGLVAGAVRPALAQGTINARDLVGTWQVMTARNLRTGEVDSLATYRLFWLHFTATRRFSIWADLDRDLMPDSVMLKLPAARRVQAGYDKIWNQAGEQRFAANAGPYTLAGNRLHYTYSLAMNTNPGDSNDYRVVRLDRTSFVYQTLSASGEGVLEITAKRIE